jgi:hypothetical protein
MTRILGEHFRSDGAPKRAWPTKIKAETGIARDQCAYQCTMCGKWHRATVSEEAA